MIIRTGEEGRDDELRTNAYLRILTLWAGVCFPVRVLFLICWFYAFKNLRAWNDTLEQTAFTDFFGVFVYHISRGFRSRDFLFGYFL